jgi:hypothetical protein
MRLIHRVIYRPSQTRKGSSGNEIQAQAIVHLICQRTMACASL